MTGRSHHIPLEFLRFSSGHKFCPSKLFRDDEPFVLYLRNLWVAWKTGAIEGLDYQDETMMDDLYDMIRIWTETESDRNYFRLGVMIGGDPEEAKK